MMTFTVRIANVPLKVTAQYESTREICKSYLSDDMPLASVVVSQSDIQAERGFLQEEDKQNGTKLSVVYSDKELEKLALHRKVTEALLPFDVLLYHGAAICVDGVGYLFTAPSGTGKTTHISLWKKLLGEKVTVINGDKPFISVRSGEVLIHGTPWQGKENYGQNMTVPLKAICILTRSETNFIEKITVQEALQVLLQQVYRPNDALGVLKVMELIDKMVSEISLYRLGCNMDIEAAEVAYNGMK